MEGEGELKQDHSSMKSWNRRTLVELLLSNGPKTRTWLSKITGLAPSAVTRLTRELMDIGILTFVQHENKVEPGRKGELLDLSQKPIAAVFDVGVTKTSFGLSFLNGKLDLISHFATPETPDEFFRIVKEKVNEMRNVYDFNILSFSIPGIVNMDSSTIILAPNLGWYDVDIPSYFGGGYEILADNEANLSMLAEASYSPESQNMTNAVFVIIREGVGTGVLIDGKVLHGDTFSAGEFGHMTISVNSEEVCHCGNTGCWELFSSIKWANNHYGELDGETQIDKFETLLRLAKDGTQKAIDILNAHAVNVGVGIANIVNAINPDVVIIGGALSDAPEQYFKKVEEETKKRALRMATSNLVIRPTTFKSPSSNLVGASFFAIERFLDETLKSS